MKHLHLTPTYLKVPLMLSNFTWGPSISSERAEVFTKLSVLFAVVLAAPFFALSQSASQADWSVEAVHLSTDKPFYFENERLIFRITAIDNRTYGVVKRNDIVYSDLLNEKGEVLQSKKLMWFDGEANGDIALPASPREKRELFLHIYAPSLLNDNDWISQTYRITVFRVPSSPLEINRLEQLSAAPEVSVVIYPSDENIVKGLANPVYYRIVNGSPDADYTLEIAGNGERQVLEGKSIGSFMLTPAEGETIHLSLLEDRTKVWEKDIHPGNSAGLVIFPEADVEGGRLNLRLLHNFPMAKTIFVKVSMEGENVWEKEIILAQPEVTISAPAPQTSDQLLAMVTVSDEHGGLLVQQPVFGPAPSAGVKWINQRPTLPAGTTPNLLFILEGDTTVLSGSQISVKLIDRQLLDVPGAALNTTAQTRQEMQLQQAGIFAAAIPNNFADWTADQKLAWVFTNPDQVHYGHAFSLSDSVSIKPDPFKKGFVINGRVIDRESGQPLAFCPLTMANTSNYSFFRFTKTDQDGFFSFDNLTFEGENSLFIALQKNYTREVLIQIKNIDTPKPNLAHAQQSHSPSLTENKQLLNEALERSIIDSVYSGTTEAVEVFYENNFISKLAGFFLKPTKVVDPQAYIPFDDMKDVFKEILPSAYLRFKKNQPLIRMVHRSAQLPPNAVVSGLLDVPALVIVDGVPIFNQAEVLKIRPANVARYELYHGLFTLGSQVYLGLIHIVTNVDYLEKTDIRGLFKFKYQGIEPPSKIAIGPSGNPGQPYLSPLGFWITEVKADRKGVIQLPVRLTEVPGEYMLVLQAMVPGSGTVVQSWPLKIE